MSNWDISTFTGIHFRFDDPEFCIEDIAHSLANLCRFNGHCKKFYSVAQHSVLAHLEAKEHPKEALMHDAVEAYMGDMIIPIKNYLLWADQRKWQSLYFKIEAKLARHFNLKHPWPSEIKMIDKMLLATEARDLMIDKGKGWLIFGPDVEVKVLPLDISIHPWTTETAEHRFLEAWERLK